MSLLNFEKTPIFWTRGTGYENSAAEAYITYKYPAAHIEVENWIDEINSRPGDYYYIEFMMDDAFSVYDLSKYIPEDIFNRIKSGDITLIIANTGHGYHQNVEGVYKDVIIKHSINPNHIILRSESFDMLDEISIISKKYNLPACRYEWVTEFERMMKDHVLSGNELPKTLISKDYNKKYISFNGLWRPHRGAIVSMLCAMNLLDKGFVSYNSKGILSTGEQTYQTLQVFLSYNEEMKSLIESTESSIKKLDRILLDIDENSNVNSANVLPTDNILYENTYFSLVTETSIPLRPFSHQFTENTDTGRILSEKIFKPIALKHPFIVVSCPRTLELLRTLGYKTFSPLIDESYDYEVDTAKRLLMIIKEVKRLCELTPSELENFLVEARKICDYNLEVLVNKTNYIHPRN